MNLVYLQQCIEILLLVTTGSVCVSMVYKINFLRCCGVAVNQKLNFQCVSMTRGSKESQKSL